MYIEYCRFLKHQVKKKRGMRKYTRAGAFSNSQIVYCRHDFKSFRCAIGIICTYREFSVW